MQRQIIVPFTTALLSQAASALNLRSGHEVAPIAMQFGEVTAYTESGIQQLAEVMDSSASSDDSSSDDSASSSSASSSSASSSSASSSSASSSEEIAMAQIMSFAEIIGQGDTAEEKCVARAEKKKMNQYGKCEKITDETKREACQQRWINWLDAERELCALPCLDQAQMRFTKKEMMCDNKGTEEAKETCKENAAKYLRKQTLKCCKAKAVGEYRMAMKDCKEHENPRQCKADAKAVKNEAIEKCNNPEPEPVDPEPVDPEPVDPEPVDPEPVDPEFDADFNDIQLQAHNAYRALHHAEAFTLCPELARQAQEYAEEMEREDKWEHSGVDGQGENLYWASNGIGQDSKGSDLWYNEVEHYDYWNPANKPEGESVGHFTQMVWKDTEKLGCGYAGTYMVCRYEPQGNVLHSSSQKYFWYWENVCPTTGCLPGI